jgi:hypothetical protein
VEEVRLFEPFSLAADNGARRGSSSQSVPVVTLGRHPELPPTGTARRSMG